MIVPQEMVAQLWFLNHTSLAIFVTETLKGLKGRNSLMFNHVLNLTTKRKKSGSNTFYVASIDTDSKQVEFSKKDLEHMDMFNELIQDENKKIAEQWKQANASSSRDDDSAKIIEAVSEDSPEEFLAT